MKKLKILFVSHMYPNPQRVMYGTFVRDYASAIFNEGVDIRICNPVPQVIWPFNYFKRYRIHLADRKYSDQLPVERIKWPTLPHNIGHGLFRDKTVQALLTAIHKMFGENNYPDIIHAHNIYPDGVIGSSLSHLLKIPLVITTHGTDNRVHVKHPLRRKTVNKSVEIANKVICVSDFVRNELIDYKLPPSKLVTIRNGVDLNRLDSGSNKINIKTRFKNKNIILSVGHMSSSLKGFDITLKAFAEIFKENPNCSAVLVLIGDGIERDSLEKLSQKLNISKNVFFEGAKSPEETMQYMSACDIFCLPSWYEAFGIVYLEAMMHAKPVIAVEGQGISEIIEHGKTGLLVPPHDSHQTANAIRILLSDINYREEIGKRGQILVNTKYSWTQTAKLTINLYNNIIAQTDESFSGVK